jgi:hypothetical protein
MTRETQYQLYRALNAHTSDLEITRSFTSGRDLEVLDRRIEAAHGLLEWVEQALERPAFPAVPTPTTIKRGSG